MYSTIYVCIYVYRTISYSYTYVHNVCRIVNIPEYICFNILCISVESLFACAAAAVAVVWLACLFCCCVCYREYSRTYVLTYYIGLWWGSGCCYILQYTRIVLSEWKNVAALAKTQSFSSCTLRQQVVFFQFSTYFIKKKQKLQQYM